MRYEPANARFFATEVTTATITTLEHRCFWPKIWELSIFFASRCDTRVWRTQCGFSAASHENVSSKNRRVTSLRRTTSHLSTPSSVFLFLMRAFFSLSSAHLRGFPTFIQCVIFIVFILDLTFLLLLCRLRVLFYDTCMMLRSTTLKGQTLFRLQRFNFRASSWNTCSMTSVWGLSLLNGCTMLTND